MQVLESYSNFVNSINSEQTRRQYEYSLTQFLKNYQIDLDSFLRLSQKEISDYIINYLVNRKISKQYKIVIFSAIKHCCEMNDVILNWKKLKKFIKSENRFSFDKGFLYFVDDIDLAALHGLEKSLLDMTDLTDVGEKMIESNPSYRDSVVIGINTWELEDRIKIDLNVNPITSEVNIPCYRYKGDIKIGNLYLCKQQPFDTFDSNMITKMTLYVNHKRDLCARVGSWLGGRCET